MNPHEMVRSHGPDVSRFAARAPAGPFVTREDVEQSVWLLALTHDQPSSDLTLWLQRLVRRVTHTERRSGARRLRRELAHADDVRRRSRRKQPLRSIRELLDDLDDSLSETLSLRYAEGLTLGEIAGRLRLPVSTVRARIESGLSALRRSLSELVEAA